MEIRKQIDEYVALIKEVDNSHNGSYHYVSETEDSRLLYYQTITGFIDGRYYRVYLWIEARKPDLLVRCIADNTECHEKMEELWNQIS